MDFLSWYGSVMLNPSSIWSNYNNHEAEGFLTSNYDSCAYPYPIQHLQIADHSLPPNLNSRGINEMAQTVTSHPPDGEGISCEEKLGAESCPSLISGPHEMNRPISNFSGSSSNAGSVLFHPVSSIESLDCLLSSPASTNTDKSVEEDDEISMLLSDCRSLLNFGEAGSGISSGESEKKSTRERKMDDAVSRSRYANDKIIKSKRRSKQTELKPAENHGGYSLLGVSNQNSAKQKKPRSEKPSSLSSNISFQQPSLMVSSSMWEPDSEAIAQMKEMIYRAAAFRPVNLGVEVVEKPKRKNVRISTDPQTVAARQRRERISERIRVLQKLVPGGSKMDTASMLDEAANYLKFLRSQIKALEGLGHTVDSIDCPPTSFAFSFNPSFPMQTSFPSANTNQIHNSQT